ncbi:hypothetical protein Mp_5g12710 [Marchantia polymorpha subsp. ruderalis]|uniref:HAT C-terminal dimerisation domain-containing protein n=2 Tax=Marchantia polymorpha TaxID=3197 RepID=A0AAF6BHP5_MARPO|nr:hypothetical protein MARPO_0092s0037 [Marchantia polymorpha]BBN11529.1 hypothetical protein Mp_5g12710 [Marchantia polymorpha subsp. ruderalis]|eukprot:PTQ33072.1 hypothetical protein MARPO_0092s0037 [Marchantia polymorpha]
MKQKCTLGKRWYSQKTNASGWKSHLQSAHGLKEDEVSCSQPSSKYLIQFTIDKPTFSEQMLRKYENAVVDYIIGGDVSLCASGSDRFKKMVFTFMNVYETPSTRTILKRITKLYRILLHMLVLFFNKLDVPFSLTMNDWSNQNLKGFYVVTAHLVDIKTLSPKSILFTILDVKCGTGVGRRVGTPLFEHLKGMGTGVLTRFLNVVSDNGFDAIVAVRRLFQLINASVGFEQIPNFNHVRCADHSIQLAVIKLFSFTKNSMESLRNAFVKIRRNKVMRQQYCLEAAAAGLSSKESTHPDSPTRWNPHIRWVMQNLAADHKPTLNMLPLSIVHLVKHCETSELQLSAINSRITLTGMQEKIEEYVKLLVLEPAIVAAYLNTQIAKPSDPMELKKLKDLIRSTLQRRYSVELQFRNSTVESEEPINSIFQALFQPHSDNSMLDEVDQFLSIGVVHCKGFIDILSWWLARMEVLPAHYKMVMDYLGTPATSTSSERVNIVIGREFTSSRQSLSSSVFIMIMCLCS